METGYLNLHDGEHFSTNTSPLYEDCLQDMLDDSDGSLLDMIRDEFSSYGVGVSRNVHDTPDLWETEQELNGDMAVLPVAVPLDGSLAKLESQTKEDFQKMLIDWQEHLGSMQVSDSEEMDVKDIVGMDMVMPKHISEHLPEDIFEDDAAALDTNTTSSPSSSKKGTPDTNSELGLNMKEELGFSIKEEFGNHCLQNFMDEEEDDLGLKVAEEDPEHSSNDKQTVSEENASDIQPKVEPDEDCVDVETVTEQIPVLEAGDLKSLLEQFEASEAFNSNSTGSSKSASVLDSHLYAMATQQLKPSTSSPTTPVKASAGSLSHQNIRDSLPQEVIDRIKASGRKRVIPVIPAIPTKRHGRGGTRMQDAGVTLSRNKLLKIVSSGSSGESVQLDHDYCTTSSTANGSDVAPPRSFYHSDASEYQGDKSNNTPETAEKQKGKYNGKDNIYSRLPEYYMVLAPQKANESKKVPNSAPREDECWGENSSKKDSGLESGEVSDASEETPALPPETVRIQNSSIMESSNNKDLVAVTIKTPSSSICGKNIVSVNGRDYHIASSANKKGPESIRINHCGQTATTKPVKEMAMVSVLKKCHIGASANTSNSSLPVPSNNSANRESAVSEEVKLLKVENQQQGPKKKKLNLEQYRSRLKELDRIRGSRESSRASSPVSSVCSVSVGTSMVEGCTSDAKSSASENIPIKCELPAANAKCDNSEASQRVMCSVEVQTVPEKEAEQQKEKEKQAAHGRDRRRRHYRSRRTSSSSSSGSSSSSSRDRRHRSRSSRSKRRKPSHRHSSKGRSTSSLESHSRSIWSRSRSQSVTSSSAKSSCSSRSARSRSRSRSNGSKRYFRSPDRRRHVVQRGREFRWSGRNLSSGPEWRRSRSPLHMNRPLSGEWQLTEREKQRQVEERRVIYVGRIEEGTTKADLRRRFEVFGPIIDISVHFREHGDNYGFVTFQYKVDAYEAVEHGNDDPNMPHYDLCFGGRRAFCKTRYADLDGMANNDPLGEPVPYKRPIRPQNNEDSFDLLLREAQAKLRKRKA